MANMRKFIVVKISNLSNRMEIHKSLMVFSYEI